MNPKTKAAPSYGYIPLETTPEVNTKSTAINNPTTIMIGTTTTLEPRTYGGQRRSPPSPPPPRQVSEDRDWAPVILFFFAAVLVVCGIRLSIISVELSKSETPVDPIMEVQSGWFSIYNLSSSRMTTKGNITFNVTKPSDCSIAFYDTIVVSLFHTEKLLSVAKIDSFFQNESNHTTVKAVFPPTVAPVEKPELERMARPFNYSSSFEFSFDVNAKGRMWQNHWKSEEGMEEGRLMNVWCRDVKVKIMMETGVGMMAEPAKCKVNTYYD